MKNIKIKKKKKRLSFFEIINLFILVLFGVVTLFPCLTVVAKALSDPRYVLMGDVGIIPKNFQLDTVLYVLKKPEFYNAFKVSVTVTATGTVLAMFMTVLAAYPLSKTNLRGRKIFLYFFVFVMLFHAGMVPTYILFRSMHLTNTLGALIFSGTFSVSNLFIMKNYFESLPESIEEAAKIDGASNTVILFRVVLPMSTPVLATISLFYGVGYWNNYFSGVTYITDPKLKSLQHYLYDLIKLAEATVDSSGNTTSMAETMAIMSSETIRDATILVSTIPILVLYPFLQKYFVKGMTVGSVKG